jgi:MYXO-CTERM domain-containing protein
MKKLKLFFGAFAVCSTLMFSNPVMAQDNTGGTSTSTTAGTTDDDDDDDSGKYGLAGLLGLLGLLGLKRRDDDRRRDTTIR